MSANSVFARLGYNFDDAKFGEGLFLTPQAKKYLDLSPPDVTEWQQNDIADGVATRSRYLKNPTLNVYTTLSSNANLIYTSANNDPANTFIDLDAGNAAMELANTTALFIIELDAFKSHTDNISGLVQVSSDSTTIPNYDMIQGMGQQILTLTHTTDNVSNSIPLLGNFTSLFVNDELESNNTIIYLDRLIMDSANVGGVSNLTANQINTIISHVQTANTLIATRRAHDWNFYAQSRAILDDYYLVKKFTTMGNTNNYLLNNYIGTDLLKSNLANS
jgi:hypothetical protein